SVSTSPSDPQEPDPPEPGSAGVRPRREAALKDARGTPDSHLSLYVEGIQRGPSQEWYKDGTLRSEGTMANGLPRGEFKEWHTNGTLASLKVFDDDGLTLREEFEWDAEGWPTRSWRLSDMTAELFEA
ncbi:toxin-antitoxin system YwqK family antitoxin, partial [Streptomyces luteolifulvus]|uniref:toxin-antitoxin system YwqK family antitoxin n=1 Tax=Streptomyces luteolifulvus TaxID=2615112 RepID=UPI0038B547D2